MPRLAFLTLDDRGHFVMDDDLAIDELTRRGITVEEIPWRRANVDWRAWDAVIIRTPWDYHRDVDAFLHLLDEIERQGVPLANPARFVRWNARKNYLRELAARGVPIVPTQWGRGLSVAELRGLPARFGVHECVVKPIVSAGADDTYRVTADLSDDAASHIARRFHDREWMAQPFLSSVATEGEYSLFYFSGELSHAVRKQPKSGDFRVQEEHGGLIDAWSVDTSLRAVADQVIAAIGETLLQARVDLVRLDDGSLALMELEGIEPSLYFRKSESSPGLFATAVERWLASSERTRSEAKQSLAG